VSLNRHSNYVPERGGVANRFDPERLNKRTEGNTQIVNVYMSFSMTGYMCSHGLP
jgi:hypothetical protein